MGQKIDYNPEDWDFQDDATLETLQSDIILPDDFFLEQSDETMDNQAAEVQEVKKEAEITAFFNGEKIQMGREHNDQRPISHEEEAFRRQIEDLFELLELEKKSSETGRIRVYQTDSSPYRPWRFH